jgi:hypothetical protein
MTVISKSSLGETTYFNHTHKYLYSVKCISNEATVYKMNNNLLKKLNLENKKW